MQIDYLAMQLKPVKHICIYNVTLQSSFHLRIQVESWRHAFDDDHIGNHILLNHPRIIDSITRHLNSLINLVMKHSLLESNHIIILMVGNGNRAGVYSYCATQFSIHSQNRVSCLAHSSKPKTEDRRKTIGCPFFSSYTI